MTELMTRQMYVPAPITARTENALAQTGNEVFFTTQSTIGTNQAICQMYEQGEWTVVHGLINHTMIRGVAEQQHVSPEHLSSLDQIAGDLIQNVRQSLQEGAERARGIAAKERDLRRRPWDIVTR